MNFAIRESIPAAYHACRFEGSWGCVITNKLGLEDILHATFPMGSMTGAPKLKSTQLIDEFESFKRGIYSGSTGFFAPNNSFDLTSASFGPSKKCVCSRKQLGFGLT